MEVQVVLASAAPPEAAVEAVVAVEAVAAPSLRERSSMLFLGRPIPSR